MNTIEELQDKYGLPLKTAQMMLENYQKRIGETHGVQQIVDIEYIGNQTKRIKLVCTQCGAEKYSTLSGGKNKWYELSKTCPCQKEEERRIKEQTKEQEKREKEIALQNEIGNIYGDYEVIGYKKETNTLIMRCAICGEESLMRYSKRGERRCTKHYIQPVKFNESYIGKKNNMLTVMGITWGKDGKRRFVCRCDCGNTTVIKPTYWENGMTKSCGCLAESLKVEHTPELDRLRNIWHSMKGRCNNPNDDRYKDYGGRGIGICEEWLKDFDSFAEWALSNGYRNDLTIDRKDVNGNYEPSNCRWADYITQANNRRDTVRYNIGGKFLTTREISERSGLSMYKVRYKLSKMDLETTCIEPRVRHGKTNKRPQDREVNLTGQ